VTPEFIIGFWGLVFASAISLNYIKGGTRSISKGISSSDGTIFEQQAGLSKAGLV